MNTPKYVFAATFVLAAAVYVAAQNAAPATPAAPGQGRGAGAPQVPDTSTPDPVVRPPNGKPLISEDFEGAQIDAKKWTTHMSGEETIGLTKEKAAHGQQALKVHYPKGVAGATTWAVLGTMLPASLNFLRTVEMFSVWRKIRFPVWKRAARVSTA